MKKHFDLILLDMLVFTIVYYTIVQVRYAISPVTHGELLLTYGVVLGAVYFAILILSKNLAGVIRRSFFKEAQMLGVQMLVSWAFFTGVLYSVKSAQDFSRSVYATSFILCYFFILIERSAWKCFIRFSKFHNVKASSFFFHSSPPCTISRIS